jgi:methylated-DNA-[protein]-cysteine S-methyltransferase
MSLYYDNYDTPLGKMEITADDQAVLSIHYVKKTKKTKSNPITNIAKIQMLQYFAGELEEFDMPMAPAGTDFQQQVWRALTSVGYGDTCCYSDIADKIENPKAVRAVGAANGKNPMTIVVPCHRIIGRDGSLTGYAGGMDKKAWLLNHEANTLF